MKINKKQVIQTIQVIQVIQMIAKMIKNQPPPKETTAKTEIDAAVKNGDESKIEEQLEKYEKTVQNSQDPDLS